MPWAPWALGAKELAPSGRLGAWVPWAPWALGASELAHLGAWAWERGRPGTWARRLSAWASGLVAWSMGALSPGRLGAEPPMRLGRFPGGRTSYFFQPTW